MDPHQFYKKKLEMLQDIMTSLAEADGTFTDLYNHEASSISADDATLLGNLHDDLGKLMEEVESLAAAVHGMT